MQAYRSLFFTRFALLLQYRTAAFAGIVTQLFWGIVKVMVLAAFFSHTASTQPMTLREAIGYVWLGQAFLIALVPWSGDREVQELIRSGAVGYDLLRPIDLYNFWFIRALAMRVTPVILRAIPILSVTMLILPLAGLNEWSLATPASIAALVAFLLSFIGAILLSAALTMLLTVSMMWTISGEGVNVIVSTLTIILSGMVVPLPLFPDWIKLLLNLLPFSGLLDQPFRLFTGNLPPEALLAVLIHQGVWIAVMIWFGRFLVSRGVNRLVIQGG
ncbi:ABC-2 family transporter protein [Phormidium tenue FACHB-886]|nr:ABC-2 family transporter protein [Phormidium tenue FACHB-886]